MANVKETQAKWHHQMRDVMRLTGASFRQIDYWIQKGWVRYATVEGKLGAGNYRLFSDEDVAQVKRIRDEMLRHAQEVEGFRTSYGAPTDTEDPGADEGLVPEASPSAEMLRDALFEVTGVPGSKMLVIKACSVCEGTGRDVNNYGLSPCPHCKGKKVEP